jgi:hypothetical protein
MTMRTLAGLVLAVVAPASAAAGDGFSLALEALPLDTLWAAGEAAVLSETDGLEVELADDSRDALVFQASMIPSSPAEYRLALWNSPMGRLYYSRAEAEAMLGREGLVHGGHTLGAGMATTAVGDTKSGLGFLLGGGSWSELPPSEKFAAAAEASIVAAILYGLVEMAD